MHHAHTNVIGLGDSSVWKVPFLPRTIYLFIAPLAVPIITPLVALGETLWVYSNISALNVILSITSRHISTFLIPLKLLCDLVSLMKV